MPRTTAGMLLLLAMAACRSPRLLDCRFFPEQKPASCTITDGGEVVVAPRSLAEAEFSPEGLAAILVANRDFYYVTRAGRTARALAFDNGPDPLVEGLARTVKGGKVGFVNPQLESVVAPVWDFAFPFQNGFAVVCTGCAPRPSGDEHSEVAGGKWGYIDPHGKVVVPVAYDREHLPQPK